MEFENIRLKTNFSDGELSQEYGVNENAIKFFMACLGKEFAKHGYVLVINLNVLGQPSKNIAVGA